MNLRLIAVSGIVVTGIGCLPSALAGPIVNLDLSVLGPAAYSARSVATGLNYPYGMATISNGSIIFGQSIPQSPFGVEGGPSLGTVWLAPKLADGSFGAPQQVISGLAGPVTNIRTSPDGMLVVDAGGASARTMSIYDSNYQLKGTVSFSYPNPGWWHSTGQSVIAPQGGGVNRIYFIVGSEADGSKTLDTVSTTGVFSATLQADSIYSVDVKLNGGALQVLGAPTQIGKGMRNPYGLTLDGAGNLIVGDNGIDGTHVVNQQGADTLYRLPAAQLGNGVFDLGFPDSYTDFATGLRVNGDPNAIQPIASFLPIVSQGITNYSEGLSGMAYAPPGSFPFVGVLGGEFITFHGSKDKADAANTHNAVEYFDFSSGLYTPILDSGSIGAGHFDTALVSGNSLFLADFASSGKEGAGGEGTGKIVQFDFAVPEPGTMGLTAFALGIAAALRHRLATSRRSRFRRCGGTCQQY